MLAHCLFPVFLMEAQVQSPVFCIKFDFYCIITVRLRDSWSMVNCRGMFRLLLHCLFYDILMVDQVQSTVFSHKFDSLLHHCGKSDLRLIGVYSGSLRLLDQCAFLIFYLTETQVHSMVFTNNFDCLP